MRPLTATPALVRMLSVLGASLACSACIFPEDETKPAKPDPNVVGCVCTWKAGTKCQYEKDTGTLTCEGPWTHGKSDLEVEKNTAVDDCLAQAKIKAGANGQSFNCVCACDPSHVATVASSAKMICK